MKFHSRRGRLLLLIPGLALCFIAAAHAAPDRLNDDVPDAAMDEAGAISFTYSHEALKLEGPLSDESIGHDYFKLRYTLNPKTALTFRYGSHNLNGGLGLVNPLFDNRDGGESFNFDLALNLLDVEAVPADPTTDKEFEAGSAFGVGISGTLYQMDMGDLASEDTLLRAYLVYTTDLSPEMRAHTIFTTSRLSGDSASGSVNRIGAGLDYTLIDGAHPLTLMANGILDVYNFRQPDFNTSRISRFDVGLRYRVSRGWYASLGYTTHNDSENDASGSGIFASFQYVDEPEPCVTCELPPAEEAAPPAAQPAPEPAQPPEAAGGTPPAAAAAQAPLMKSTNQDATEPAAADDGAGKPETEPSAENQPSDSTEETAPPAEEPAAAAEESDATADKSGDSSEEAASPPEDSKESTDQAESAPEEVPTSAAAGMEESGILIPALAEEQPHQTPADAVMVRAAGAVIQMMPHHTSAEDVLLRTPVGSTESEISTIPAAAEPGQAELLLNPDLLAIRYSASALPLNSEFDSASGSNSNEQDAAKQVSEASETADSDDG